MKLLVEAVTLGSMRSNRLADEATLWTLLNILEAENVWSSLPELRDGWRLDREGALLLASRPTSQRPSDLDLTGYEALEDHIHLDPSSDSTVERLGLWADGLRVAVAGLRSAAELTPSVVVAVVGLGGPGQGATVRWHQQRHAAGWVSDDLEGFRHEAVLVLTTEDLSIDSLGLAHSHDAALEDPDPDVVAHALVAFALEGDDRLALEAACRRAADHATQSVRDTAGLCIGHIGRRFGTIEDESWTVVQALAAAPQSDGRPSDALDDLRQFAGR